MLKVSALKVHGLAPISFELAKGDCLAVRGPSGVGKSLLLRAIADLDEAEGSVSLDGLNRSQMAPEQWRRKVRYLAAESGWWLERAGDHFKELESAQLLGSDLGLPADLFSKQIAHLSSGERQRLSFIRGIEDRPEVLLLDEPTSSLDKKAAGLLEAKILALREQGIILVVVTHSAKQAAELANQTLALENGSARMTAS